MLERAGALFRWLAGAVVPMFVRPLPPVGLAWFVHALLVTLVAVGLFFAQRYGGLTPNITRGPVWFHDYWLATLFLLLYLLCWAGVWLWGLLTPDPYTSAYPDLDAAWGEIVAALEKAGIGLADTPVFLVFGDFPAGLDVLFRGLPHGLAVAGGSAAGSPLRAYANRDGIYLAVPGASLLGVQQWFGEADDDLPEAEQLDDGPGLGGSVGLERSIGIDRSLGASIRGSMMSDGPPGPFQEIQRIVRRAREERRPLTDDEKERVRRLSGPAGSAPAAAAPAAPAARAGQTVLNDPRLLAQGTERLSYVCGLVAAARWPLCPVNGALVAVPASAADRDDAQQWGLVARADLDNATAALRLNFPVFALVGGLEGLPGGDRFFRRFAAERGGQRLGKGFPLNPDLTPEAAGGEIETAAAWAVGRLLPYHVFRQMRAEADATENAALFRFLVELRRRAPRLARLVSRMATDGRDAPVFGGCYVATAADGEVQFLKEFFKKVEAAQAAVAWTDAAYVEDAAYRSRAAMGYAVLAIEAIVVAALAAYTVYAQLRR